MDRNGFELVDGTRGEFPAKQSTLAALYFSSVEFNRGCELPIILFEKNSTSGQLNGLVGLLAIPTSDTNGVLLFNL
jgi:hypothetical protein